MTPSKTPQGSPPGGSEGPRKKRQGSPKAIHRVLVTGAAGSVGRLLLSLLLKSGYEVVATDRGEAPDDLRQAEVEPAKLTWRSADLTHREVIPPLMEGVDAVIHTAAWVDITIPFSHQAPINLHAVMDLFQEAVRRGVRRFVHFSTGSLYASSDSPLREDSPRHPTSAYEETKLLAEDYLESQRGQGTQITVLRPALIYGPRGKVLVSPVATVPPLVAPLNGIMPRLEGGPRTNLVHATDVARAAKHLLDRHQKDDLETFNVACTDIVSMGELFNTVLEVGGIRALPVALPFPQKALSLLLPVLSYELPFRLLNAGAQQLWRHHVKRHGLEPALAPRVDREATPYLAGDVVFDSSRLKATGFKFSFPTFREGWAQTVQWYQDHSWLPREAPTPRREAQAQSPNLRIAQEEVRSS